MLITALLMSFLLLFAGEKLSYEEIKKAYYRSYMYEKVRDYTNAIKALMPVYLSFPNGYTVNLRLGWLYYLAGKYKNSEYHYRKAITAIPSSIEAKLGLILPLKSQKRWDEVEKIAYEILKVDYYNYYGNLYLCEALESLKKLKLLEKVSRKMLYIYPTDVNFLAFLGKSYYYQGLKQKAISIFKDLLILDPENYIAKEFLKKLKSEEK